jgi:hypothetical protein
MIRSIRMRARPVALALLWSLVGLAALAASPHQIECADEVATVVVHDAGGHAIGAVRTSEDPPHCVLCHWIRAFSADGIRSPRVAVFSASSFVTFSSPVDAPHAAARLNLPSRAPPTQSRVG